ncbi:hypothetical protein A6A08_08575 [Nocardiopsis sp. TSRI0078]|uniref:hypothetical protein n=1 Tax=unclassified Nocardiopsis TaxID=2649073 RepID=UPI00093BDAF5|nr:hypothetical protein [Nocardiopsis sp. TSRI0078]OKI15621.1 hypothetical protein A6A08_08575 [Nocardiopsis sp. TSRI0078]
MYDSAGPSPTEVVISWIPYDARFRERAVRHALEDAGGRLLYAYVDNLVNRDNDDGRPLDEYDLRTMAAVREDLNHHSLASVDWRQVRDRLVAGVHRPVS